MTVSVSGDEVDSKTALFQKAVRHRNQSRLTREGRAASQNLRFVDWIHLESEFHRKLHQTGSRCAHNLSEMGIIHFSVN